MKETKRVLFFTTSEMAPDDSFFQAITTLFGFFTRDGIEFENDFLESVKEHPILWVAGTGVVLYTGALLCTVYYVYDWWKSLGK